MAIPLPYQCISDLYIVHLKLYAIWQLYIDKAGVMAALRSGYAPRHSPFHSASLYCRVFTHLRLVPTPCPRCHQHHFHNTLCTFASLCFLWVLPEPLQIFSLVPHLYGGLWSLVSYFTNALFGDVTDKSHKGEQMCLEKHPLYLECSLLCFFPSLQAPLRHSDIGSRPLDYPLMASRCSSERRIQTPL